MWEWLQKRRCSSLLEALSLSQQRQTESVLATTALSRSSAETEAGGGRSEVAATV